METFTTDRGIVLEYEVSGSGKPFLFLHGLGGSIGQIRSTYEARDGVMLIALNQQGHGNSGADWETLSFERLADDAVCLLDHLGIEKAVFGGISMGAAVSLAAAVRHPERVEGLLLIRNAWTDRPMDHDRILAYEDMGRCLKEGGKDAFMKTAGWEIVREPSAYTRNAFLLPFGEEPNIRNWRKFLILPNKAPVPDEACLEKLRMPVRIVACRNDFCHPFGYGVWLRERIPGALFTEIPDKDRDGAAHKRMINEVIGEMFA